MNSALHAIGMRSTRYFSLTLAALILVASVALLSMRGTLPHSDSAAAAVSTSAPPADPTPVAPMDTALFRNIARRQNPVVVAIMTKTRVDSTPVDDVFGWFYGQPRRPERRTQRGLGSGFLISADGEILTNDHVVAGADVIEVGLFGNDTKTYRAALVGHDPLSDSALIKLEHAPAGLPVATLGNSDGLEPGDWVMAIGNPFQLGHTVTVGVVSYQGRPFEVQEGRWQRMIQTDASINPGNSGGPLLNVRGEVVGINAAILGSPMGGNIGIGFAVPINTVRTLLPQLRKGEVVHGRIGVQLRSAPVTEADARALGLPKAQGAIVIAVEPDSPADRAGLEAGDVIVSFNGQPVAGGDELVPRVAATRPGTEVTLGIVRDGQARDVQVAVDRLVLDGARGVLRQRSSAADFGLTLGDVTASIADQLRLPDRMDGAVVFEVAAGSPAERAAVREGDVVLRVNRRPVHGASAAREALRQIPPDGSAYLLVWREGHEALVEMQRED